MCPSPGRSAPVSTDVHIEGEIDPWMNPAAYAHRSDHSLAADRSAHASCSCSPSPSRQPGSEPGDRQGAEPRCGQEGNVMKAATTADGSTDAFVITTALESEAGLRVCRGGELWGVLGATRRHRVRPVIPERHASSPNCRASSASLQVTITTTPSNSVGRSP